MSELLAELRPASSLQTLLPAMHARSSQSTMSLLERPDSELEPPARPMLLRRVRNFAGDYEFRRIDHQTSTIACAGYGSIGKVKVHCRYHFSKSHWGVLGEDENPAGIIYLDLDFDEPPDCRLKSAVVLVTLEDRDTTGRHATRRRDYYDDEGGCPAKFTDCYGPRQLSGELREAEMRSAFKLNPEVEAAGVKVAGPGYERETTKTAGSRWTINGKLVSDGPFFKTLKWRLTENDFESRAFHGSLFRTAFAFEHDGKQFRMKVEVKGKLNRLKNRMGKTLQFGRDEDDCTVTLVRFGKPYAFRRDLQAPAECLPQYMEWANMFEIPVEVPDAMRARFWETAPGGNPETQPEAAPTQPDEGGEDGDANYVPLLDFARAAGLLPAASASTTPLPARPALSGAVTPRFASDTTLPGRNPLSAPPALMRPTRSSRPVAEVEPAQKLIEQLQEPLMAATPLELRKKQQEIEVILWLAKAPMFLLLMKLIAFVLGYGKKTGRGVAEN